MTTSEQSELNERVSQRLADLLAATERAIREGTDVAAAESYAAAKRYVAAHREWWSVSMPDVDYDSVFGAKDRSP